MLLTVSALAAAAGQSRRCPRRRSAIRHVAGNSIRTNRQTIREHRVRSVRAISRRPAGSSGTALTLACRTSGKFSPAIAHASARFRSMTGAQRAFSIPREADREGGYFGERCLKIRPTFHNPAARHRAHRRNVTQSQSLKSTTTPAWSPHPAHPRPGTDITRAAASPRNTATVNSVRRHGDGFIDG
jgi:hypothetical protein